MKVYRDAVDGFWRISEHEQHHFTSESDAETAIEFAFDYALDELCKESRYRRAAEPAKSREVA